MLKGRLSLLVNDRGRNPKIRNTRGGADLMECFEKTSSLPTAFAPPNFSEALAYSPKRQDIHGQALSRVLVEGWFDETHPGLVRINSGSTYCRVVVGEDLPPHRSSLGVKTLVIDVLV